MKILKKTEIALVLLALSFLNGQCSSSKLKGSVTTTHPVGAEAVPEDKVKPDPIPDTPVPEPTPDPEPVPVEPEPLVIPTEQEQVNDCSACLVRAKQLSATIGFEASMAKTINLGFYKVSPRFGLCDIHFMNDLNDEIEDHDGSSSSVLNTQVVLYCPCTCDWGNPFNI